MEKFDGLFVVLDLLLFLKVLEVLGELFRGSQVFVGLGFFELFVVLPDGLFHVLEFGELFGFLTLVG